MRGGLAAIQQTLTPEAASVLTHSISEAGRRNHGQTTPLHVAATLLSSPTGFLRQACIRSHPNSSHPLQCRALELCFSVALERLPAAQTSGGEPPISNALMAALKRAQAHQRRGCPENQQQPLLAVKVELEQLIISILDDPSVSRVMREASFSSPAVKATIEMGLNCRAGSGPGSMGYRPGPGPLGGGEKNLYLNPWLQQQQQHGCVGVGYQRRGEDVRRVMDILCRHKKRNPVLVGETEPQEVVREVVKNVEIHDGVLQNVEVVSIEKELGGQMPAKLRELGGLIERKMVVNSRGGNGVVVDLGDLKWLVDQPSNQEALEAARGAVSELGKIVRKFGEGSKIWVIGVATCETYLRCQVYHPTMENEWDLQVVSIVARPSIHGMLPRLGSNGVILSNSNFSMGVPPLTRRVSENLDPSRRYRCCPQCTEKCNQEVAELKAEQAAKSSHQSDDVSDVTPQSLPLWLQNAKLQASDDLQGKNQDLILRQKTQELHKKWSEQCRELHPNFHLNLTSERITQSPLLMTGLYNPNLLGRQPLQPKLQQPRTLGDTLQLNISTTQRPNADSPPGSPVRTDLILGPTKRAQSIQDKDHKERVKDFLGCISSEPHNKLLEGDVDSFKRLVKGLTEKVWWQSEAASSLASAITKCKLGNGKRRGGGSRGDVWLLFLGPDRTGKRKMASALSELMCDGVKPIVISLGTRRYGDESSDLNFRGKTTIDRIVEGLRRNPSSVMVLQDIDEAEMVVRSSIRRAMERGRLTDSHGREFGLGNAIFVITSSWVPHKQQLEGLSGGGLSEERMTSLASGGWQLRISIMGEKSTGSKRPPPNWLLDHNDDDGDYDDRGRSTKQRKENDSGISFDLNRIADIEEDRLDGSNNSSDLTVDHEDEHVQEHRGSPTSSTSYELFGCVDETITFKPVDITPVRQNIERTITTKFSTVVGETVLLKIENKALERIMSGMWLGKTALETWVEKVLNPSILQLKMNLSSLVSHFPEGKIVARLELDKESESRGQGDWLPGKISVVTDAQ